MQKFASSFKWDTNDAWVPESLNRSAQVSPVHISASTAEHELNHHLKSRDWGRAAAAWCPSWLDREQRRYRSDTWTPPVHAKPHCAIFWHLFSVHGHDFTPNAARWAPICVNCIFTCMALRVISVSPPSITRLVACSVCKPTVDHLPTAPQCLWPQY